MVPTVPGALGDKPLPKPKASNKTGERTSCEKRGLTVKVIKPSL